MWKLAGDTLAPEQPNSGQAAQAEEAEKGQEGSQRGLWPYPGLRGKVSAGPQLSAWGRELCEWRSSSPSSASYVPEDLCAGAWGAGGGDKHRHFGKQERPHARGKGGRAWGWSTPTANPRLCRQARACGGPGSQARTPAAPAPLWSLPMPTLPLSPGVGGQSQLGKPTVDSAWSGIWQEAGVGEGSPQSRFSPKDLASGRAGSVGSMEPSVTAACWTSKARPGPPSGSFGEVLGLCPSCVLVSPGRVCSTQQGNKLYLWPFNLELPGSVKSQVPSGLIGAALCRHGAGAGAGAGVGTRAGRQGDRAPEEAGGPRGIRNSWLLHWLAGAAGGR